MNKVLTEALGNWRSLNEKLPEFSEAQVLEMLEWERNHERRLSVLLRLHQRYNMLRVARERVELMKDGDSL